MLDFNPARPQLELCTVETSILWSRVQFQAVHVLQRYHFIYHTITNWQILSPEMQTIQVRQWQMQLMNSF